MAGMGKCSYLWAVLHAQSTRARSCYKNCRCVLRVLRAALVCFREGAVVGRCGFEHFGPPEELHEELVRMGSWRFGREPHG